MRTRRNTGKSSLCTENRILPDKMNATVITRDGPSSSSSKKSVRRCRSPFSAS